MQVGCHSVDADLLQLCQDPPPGGVHIVTRNSCRDDIRTFLRQQVVFISYLSHFGLLLSY